MCMILNSDSLVETIKQIGCTKQCCILQFPIYLAVHWYWYISFQQWNLPRAITKMWTFFWYQIYKKFEKKNRKTKPDYLILALSKSNKRGCILMQIHKNRYRIHSGQIIWGQNPGWNAWSYVNNIRLKFTYIIPLIIYQWINKVTV